MLSILIYVKVVYKISQQSLIKVYKEKYQLSKEFQGNYINLKALNCIHRKKAAQIQRTNFYMHVS